MRIRLAEDRDYEPVMGLLRQLNRDDPEPTDIQLGVFERIVNTDGLYLIVVEDGAQLVGTCYLNVIPNLTRGGRPYGVIENVVTDGAHRQLGVGQKMMDWAVALAWELGCYKVMLMTGRKEAAVHAFYRKCGFDGASKRAYIVRDLGAGR